MGEPVRFCTWLLGLCAAMLVAALIAVSLATRARAEAICMAYPDLVRALDKIGEKPSGSGIMGGGKAVMLVFASPGGTTWTMALLGPGERACVVAAGQDWLEVVPPKGKGKETGL
ncbi:MAG: hypothetical protein WBA88_13865 [Pseudaminobacter sp.]